MRACAALVLVLATACSSDSQSIRIERQPASLAAAKADGWLAGSAVIVGEPGAFSFPQPVSIRITLVEREASETADMPLEPKLVSMSKVTVFGEGVGEITQNVRCQPSYCDAELTIGGFGLAMLQVTAQNTEGEEADCFYYGVYEEVEPAAVGSAHKDAAELAQRDCQRDLFD